MLILTRKTERIVFNRHSSSSGSVFVCCISIQQLQTLFLVPYTFFLNRCTVGTRDSLRLQMPILLNRLMSGSLPPLGIVLVPREAPDCCSHLGTRLQHWVFLP
ncbi:unnamed protein product [Ectocarpus sp. 12 AP-2014]